MARLIEDRLVWPALALLVAAIPLGPGQSRPHASHTGTLVVSWRIGGRATSDACDHVGAASVRIDVFDERKSEVASLVPPCSAFTAAVALPEGKYEVHALPEDRARRPVSILMFDRVSIEAGSSRTVSFNFPSWVVANPVRPPIPQP